jgi:hypothetical protein
MTAVVTAPGRLYAASPGAWQLTYNGLLIGDGADVGLLEVHGLRELPPVRTGATARPRAHGTFGGRNYYDKRIVDATFLVQAPSNDFEAVLAACGTAFANIVDPAGALPLRFQLGSWSGPRQVTCRPVKGGVPVNVDYAQRRAEIPVQFEADDPLIYDTAAQTPITGLPSPTAGLGFPAGAPFAFGASSGGSLSIANAGNEPTPPVFTITGPCTWPQLTLGSLFLAFAITLGAGDTLVVDCNAQTATLNGTADRGNTVVTGSEYFLLPVGSSTVGFSSVDATQVTGTCQAAAASAWGWY